MFIGYYFLLVFPLVSCSDLDTIVRAIYDEIENEYSPDTGGIRLPYILNGKTAVVTGADSGIGKETVFQLYQMGAKVIAVSITMKLAEQNVLELEERGRNRKVENVGILVPKAMDLASLESVRKFSREIMEEEDEINILINNAGVIMKTDPSNVSSEDGYEMIFAVNHLGPFLLTILLLPRMTQTFSGARIVNVSSEAHSRRHNHNVIFFCTGLGNPMFAASIFKFYRSLPKNARFTEETAYPTNRCNFFISYAKTKIANVLFAKELARRLEGTNVKTYSLHPGKVFGTGMWVKCLKLLIANGFPPILAKGILLLIRPFFKSIKEGAATTIFCAASPECAHQTGLYYENCQEAEPDPITLDEERARELWNLSWKLTGLGNFNFYTNSIENTFVNGNDVQTGNARIRLHHWEKKENENGHDEMPRFMVKNKIKQI